MLSRFSWKKNLCGFVHFCTAKTRFKIEQEKKEASLDNKLFHSTLSPSTRTPQMNLLVLFLPIWVLSISLSSPILHAASFISVSQNAQAESPGTTPTTSTLIFNIPFLVSARSVLGSAFYELALVLNSTKFWTWNPKLHSPTVLFLLPISCYHEFSLNRGRVWSFYWYV